MRLIYVRILHLSLDSFASAFCPHKTFYPLLTPDEDVNYLASMLHAEAYTTLGFGKCEDKKE